MSENKKCNYKLILMITITLVLLLFICFCYFFSSISMTNRKYAKDYSAIDILIAHKIDLDYMLPTEKMMLKYDINEDGKINDVDVKIIQQMVLGFYDYYEVRNSDKKVVKYIM